jgi:KaiC/GvpD/RAD55 family RecA-like ATPase
MKKPITHLMSLFNEPSGIKHYKDNGDPIDLHTAATLAQISGAPPYWIAPYGTYPQGIHSALARLSGLGGGTLPYSQSADKLLQSDKLLAPSIALMYRSGCGHYIHFLYRLDDVPNTNAPTGKQVEYCRCTNHTALADYLQRHGLALAAPDQLLPLDYDPAALHRETTQPLPLDNLRQAADLPLEDAPTQEVPHDTSPKGEATDPYTVPPMHERFDSMFEEAARQADDPARPTRIRTMGQRLIDASNAPELVSLFGCLWETPSIAILVGDTGVGKSVLAVHIAHLITSDKTSLLGLSCSTRKRVLYYDFELTDRQLEKRFPKFPFTADLLTCDFNPDAVDVESFTVENIAADIDRTGATVIILDNITALALKTTADADVSIGIMKGLKRLQRERGVSSLVLAHVPKIAPGVALNLNHLAGSKHLSNFADSVFFISRSVQGQTVRYLKQAKNRTSELLPNVLTFELFQNADGYLDLSLIGDDDESNHLDTLNEAAPSRTPKAPRDKVIDALLGYLTEPRGAKALEDIIGKQVGVSGRTIRPHLQALVASGEQITDNEGQSFRLLREQVGKEHRYRLQKMAPTT